MIWDVADAPPRGEWTTVLWCSFGDTDDPKVISIPKLVEEQADSLRARYLAWIYDLGETRIKGKRVIDHLQLRPGFSYWWMTLLAQKFNASGSSYINDAIKLFALEEMISRENVISIKLMSRNRKLACSLRTFCRRSGLLFEQEHVRGCVGYKTEVRPIYRSLPFPLQSLIYLAWYVWQRLPLLTSTKQGATPDFSGKVTFFDSLVHLDRQAFSTGNFISNYWTALVDHFTQAKLKTNWLHNYFKHDSISSLSLAQTLIKRFNESSGGLQSHALIDAYLSPSVFFKALRDYFRIVKANLYLRDVSRHFQPTGSTFNFWPLFKREWLDSLRGQSAMTNCLQLCLFEEAMSHIPWQALGFYIQENQAWEMALIHAWQAVGHGNLVGVPHTTVRAWDLRYFYDSRSYDRSGENVLPMPHQVAVNGPVARKAYIDGGYPESQVTEGEALRFLHLCHIRTKTRTRVPREAFKVLVCGDFLSSTNHKILSWLAAAAQSIPKNTSYIFKPHPAYTTKASGDLSITLETVNAPLADLLANCDVVFASNTTSAAVEAYYSGIPVVQMLDGSTFNMSPLRGLPGVVYVTNPKQLAKALSDVRQGERVVPAPYFYLDEKLPRWRQVLGSTPFVLNS